jgi:hypothetical protein
MITQQFANLSSRIKTTGPITMGAPVPNGLTTIKLKNKLYLYQSLWGHLGLTTVRLKNELCLDLSLRGRMGLTIMKLKNE